ncbi:MAG: glycerol-3-phosphate dehydrogenase/oxidase [Gammaproteobacteria bacterium]|nr:glycerol-3-phosphate dehydrogenase/oxidase [Gammaproteobacteria bacterium]
MTRDQACARLESENDGFDIVVIGGGASGAGIAFDAAWRGYRVALFERGAFGAGTSSRSSKLIHGGLRYLGLGQLGLVREALHERARLLANAPAIVAPLGFVIPTYSRFERCKFRLGLALYDRLAGAERLQRSHALDTTQLRQCAPTVVSAGLRGALWYADAGFDDSRLLLALLAGARRAGALTLNHAEVTALLPDSNGRIGGVVVHDRESDREHEVRARVVINAGGPYGDAVRALEGATRSAHIAPSQGTHIVVPARFHPGRDVVVFPRTHDGRIMFAIPWHGHVVLGTTDSPVTETRALPRAQAAEVDEILDVARNFLDPAPQRADISSVFAGLRPLAGAPDGAATARRSREHTLDVSAGGLVSVSGGKWTTYRLIAEQAVDLAVASAGLAPRQCTTRDLGFADGDPAAPYAVYGEDAPALATLASADPALAAPLDPRLPCTGVEYVWACRAELAVHVGEALAYHTRAMFLDAAAASATAPRVAALMAAELGRDEAWIAAEVDAARQLAEAFSLTPIPAPGTPG